MKIEILEKCKTVNNQPVKPKSIMEIDANTARNLIKKGFAAPADDEAKKLDLELGSRLTAVQAQANIANILSKRAQQKQRVAA